MELWRRGDLHPPKPGLHVHELWNLYRKSDAYNGYDEPMSSPGILITVNSFPSVSFTASTTAGKPNTTVIFADQSKGFPSPTKWYMGLW